MEAKDVKETERTVRVIDDSDRDWKTTGHQQLMSLNEAGDVPGHYMYVDGKSVLTNAVSTNQKTLFKIHDALEFDAAQQQSHQVVILENKSGSVVAINEDDDTVIAKHLPTPPSAYNTLDQVKRDHSEVLFYKIPRERGSEYFYFKSYLKDKQRILGFDENGNPMNTTEVQPDHPESLFSLI